MTEDTPSSSPTLQRMHKLGNISQDDIGKHVTLHGWVYAVRTQDAGRLCFVDVGDGSTISPVRCLAQKPPSEDDNKDEEVSDASVLAVL